MPKELPPSTEVTDDELARARDGDALVELHEKDRALAQGPHGLCFALSLDLRPTLAFVDAVADALEQTAKPKPKRLRAKRRKR